MEKGKYGNFKPIRRGKRLMSGENITIKKILLSIQKDLSEIKSNQREIKAYFHIGQIPQHTPQSLEIRAKNKLAIHMEKWRARQAKKV
jgi:hypothetical protein